GISAGGNADCPQTNTRWSPTASRGRSFASSTACSKALPPTIRLVLVRMPSSKARIMARLTASEYPKSSPLTINFVLLINHSPQRTRSPRRNFTLRELRVLCGKKLNSFVSSADRSLSALILDELLALGSQLEELFRFSVKSAAFVAVEDRF